MQTKMTLSKSMAKQLKMLVFDNLNMSMETLNMWNASSHAYRFEYMEDCRNDIKYYTKILNRLNEIINE